MISDRKKYKVRRRGERSRSSVNLWRSEDRRHLGPEPIDTGQSVTAHQQPRVRCTKKTPKTAAGII